MATEYHQPIEKLSTMRSYVTEVEKKTVTVFGLGTMGAAMAVNLASAGYTTRGWNRSSDRPGVRAASAAGVVVVESPTEAVAGSNIVLSCVTDIDALNQIFTNELLDSLEPGTIVVDTSTIGPSNAVAFGQRLVDAGVGFVDAPVTGGDVGARDATLSIMAGGETDHIHRVGAIFDVIGGSSRHCGPIGSGQSLKMVNQVLCAVSTTAVAEALALAEAQGLDPALVTEVCGPGAGGSWSLTALGPRVIAGNFEPGFRTQDLDKDLRLALGRASDLGLDLPVADAAHDQFKASLAEHPEAGTQAVYLQY